MGFQRNQHFMLLGVIDHFVHQDFGETMMLVVGINCKVDHMQAIGLMKLVGPAGVQIIFSLNEIPEGFETWIFLNETSVCSKGRFGLSETILQNIVRFTFIRDNQNAVQFTAV